MPFQPLHSSRMRLVAHLLWFCQVLSLSAVAVPELVFHFGDRDGAALSSDTALPCELRNVVLGAGVRGRGLRVKVWDPGAFLAPHSPLQVPAGSFTLSSWVAGRWVGNSHNIVAKSCNGSYRLRILKGGRLWLLLNDGVGTEIVTSSITVPERQWVHVAAVISFEEHTVRFHVGSQLPEVHRIEARRVASSAGPLVVGAYDTVGHEAFNGWLDEVRIEHRAVRKEEIQARVTGLDLPLSPYLDAPPLPSGAAETAVSPEDVFFLMISARAGFRSAAEFARIKAWLAPDGDGPYVRLGLAFTIPYMAWSRADTDFVLTPDAPLTRRRLQGVRQLTDMAAAYGIPLKIGCGGGPWFDPARDEMDAADWLEQYRRNCMWYADHRVQADTPAELDPMPFKTVERQLDGASFGDVYLTFSRYCLEVQELKRKNRQAALRVIASFHRAHPELLVAVNVDGELELALHHGNLPSDYNPYAILEFRDWVRGQGVYGPDAEYGSDAYVNWRRYQGPGGLTAFNSDFGTEFGTWELKFFATEEFAAVGAGELASFDLDVDWPRGFDPPREATGVESFRLAVPGQAADSFWELWNTFRALMVRNEYAVCAKDAVAAGIPPELIYTQSIPGAPAYASAERIWQSAVPRWGGLAPNARLGLNLFGDARWWIDAYLDSLGGPAWGSPEWRFHDVAADPAVVADTLRTYWAHGCRFAAPLVWPDHLQDTATGEGIRRFVQRCRQIPRRRAGQHRTPAPQPPEGAKRIDGGTQIYGF